MSESHTTRSLFRWVANTRMFASLLRGLMVGSVLMLLPSCAPGVSRDLQSVSSIRLQWTCALPQFLNGPLDTKLPLYLAIVRVAADDGGQVGIAWVRDTEGETEPGEFVGMAIVNSSGVVGSGFLKDMAPDLGFPGEDASLGAIAYADGKWLVPMALWPSGEQSHPSSHGIAIAKFDVLGWKKPVIRIPERFLPDRLWLFPEGQTTHLFWFEYYSQDGDLLDILGGSFQADLFRLDHAVIEPGTPETPAKVRTLYDRNLRRHTNWETGYLLRLGPNRYDFIVRREKALTVFEYLTDSTTLPPDDLLHLPNITGRLRRLPSRIARTGAASTIAAFPVRGTDIGVVWLEQFGESMSGLDVRLRETHMINNSWSKPHEIARGKRWKQESLAVATFSAGDHPAALAIWRDEHSHLMYTVGVFPGGWSKAVRTNLTIGKLNRLVYSDGHFMLVTKIGRELYWCYFDVKSSNLEKGNGTKKSTSLRSIGPSDTAE